MSFWWSRDDVGDMVERMLEAKREYDQCVASCETSAGYHCAMLRSEYDEARNAFIAALNKLIDERIQAALSPTSAVTQETEK